MKKKNNNPNIKIMFIAIGICLCIIISIFVCIYSLEKDEPVKIEASVKQDIESIINNLGSKFIAQKQSEEAGFVYDIYLEFKEDIYVDGKSNERLYTNLMSQVISNLKVSVRFIDESQDLIIRATFDEEDNRYYYTVNGEDDYFKKQDSINSLNRNTIIQNSEFRIQSELLNQIISNDWKTENVSFGSKESIFEDYEIYFDEGYQICKKGKNIVHILFTKNYEEKIVNNIGIGDDIEKIKKSLGEPTFFSNDIIGYKNEQIYIFFHNDEVSIYKNKKYDYEEFEDILNQYITEEINIREFTNRLTYLWDDYYHYNYDSSYVSLDYVLQGVQIYLTPDSPKGITIYNNYRNIQSISNLIKDGYIKADLDNDLVFLEEQNRISTNNQRSNYQLNKEEFSGSSKNFYPKVENNKVEFYSINNLYPSCRLTDCIESYLWFSDNIFIYSVKEKGIYYYDLETREKYEIVTGNDDYKFNSFKDGILVYDNDKKLEIGSD